MSGPPTGNILAHGEAERSDKILLMDIEANCFECRHLHEDQDTCDAFPDGIPSIFLYLESVHNHPYPGDHGVMFEPIHEHGVKRPRPEPRED